VIEDAAQSPGVKYKGRSVGAIGDIGGFSLNFHKHIHTGEGGMLVTNDDEIALRARLIRNHGENAIEAYGVKDLTNIIGSNYRLTELQAAIGICQLDRLDNYLALRKDLALYLSDKLAVIPGLDARQNIEHGDHAFYVFPMKYDAKLTGLSRSLFVKAVNAEFPAPSGAEGIALSEAYVRPLYLNPVYQKQIALGSKGFPFNFNQGITYHYEAGLCPVTEDMYQNKLLLSSIVREPLTREDMDDLVRAIRKVLAHAGEIAETFGSLQAQGVQTPLEAANATNVR
jgi:dTDP-4-amino-4,6-dideoxygalactose transaminase